MVTPKQALISSSVALALASVAPAGASELDVLKEQVQALSQEIQQLKADQTTVSYSRRAGAASGGEPMLTGPQSMSYMLGGTQFRLGAFARMQANWDGDYQSTDVFTPENLPSGANQAGPTPRVGRTSFNSSARQSRLWLDAKKKAGNGTAIRGRLEFDFHGLFSAGNSHRPRLRHAWFDYGKLKWGQTWSTVVMLFSGTPDLNFGSGPANSRTRQAIGRATFGNFAVALEDIRNVGLAGSIEEFPDLTAQWNSSFGAVKVGVSGVVGQIKTANDSDTGWGLHVGVAWGIGKNSKLLFNAITTEGRARYFGRTGIADATSTAGVISVGEVDGVSLGWSQKVGTGSFNIFYGRNDYGVNTATGPFGGVSRDEVNNFLLNYIWSPAKGISFGAQYQRGERTDTGFAKVSNDRIILSGTYNFTR